MPPKVKVLPGLRNTDSAPLMGTKGVFICQECGVQRPKWQGKCDDCGAWSSFVDDRREFEVTAAELTTQMKEPVALSRHPGYWLYRDRFLKTDAIGASEETLICVKYAVLMEEKKLAKIRTDLDALDQTDDGS